jgi:hypothetical protein
MSRLCDTNESIFQRSDDALYASKRSGRNQVQCELTARDGDERSSTDFADCKADVSESAQSLQSAD